MDIDRQIEFGRQLKLQPQYFLLFPGKLLPLMVVKADFPNGDKVRHARHRPGISCRYAVHRIQFFLPVIRRHRPGIQAQHLE